MNGVTYLSVGIASGLLWYIFRKSMARSREREREKWNEVCRRFNKATSEAAERRFGR